jgi:hypothetical protein
MVRRVAVAGRVVVEGGRHVKERDMLDGFAKAMQRLGA